MRTTNWDNFKPQKVAKAPKTATVQDEDQERPATVLIRKSQASVDKYLDKLMPFPF